MTHSTLKKQLRVPGAVLLGLGAMIGTGVFISISIAASVAGLGVLLAIVIGAMVATCNGLNSAQLAASHPVSGGSYEYGYRYLTPWLGFTAGWMFLLAKSASAASAALGFASYFLSLVQWSSQPWLVPMAFLAVAVLTTIASLGVQRSNLANTIIVSLSLGSLACFVVAGLASLPGRPLPSSLNWGNLLASGDTGPALLQASALMFVAYTGYGRVATMGEEVIEPKRTIPRAIIATLAVTLLIYVLVAIVCLTSVDVQVLGNVLATGAAPLEFVASTFKIPGVGWVMALGAMTAMLGVLLNLVLGLSRVLLAMGRRRDMPAWLAKLNAQGTTPVWAVWVVGAAIAALVLVGNIKTTWSFSAFTVLIYYAITNLAALKIPPAQRLYPQWLAYVGLSACLFLAFWVDRQVWLAGLALIGAGWVWYFTAKAIRQDG